MNIGYTIGYIDEDPKQVKIFTETLKAHNIKVVGYEITKGMSEEELLEQVYASQIDLLMIDYLLKSKGILTFNGDELERRFVENKPNFPVIIFTSNENDAFDFVDDPNIIYEKDMVLDQRLMKFVAMIEKNIERYRSYISKRKLLIAELLEKGASNGLSAVEKDQLLTLQEELNALDKTKRHEIPKQLTSTEALDDISKTRKDAEAFLQSLIDQRKK